jgi:glycosyltransferase involved in cell wall biosynthesis
MGEYARSAAIAHGAHQRWPGAAIRFLLSREAPYAKRVAFPVDLLPSSPTFHSAAVIRIIEQWRPDVVIFDNAGRTRQLAAAKRLGAAVVYVSARPRQRRKAFRLRWMRLIDEHWIAYPEFIAGSLTWVERCKLHLMHRPRVRYLDVILARHAATPAISIVSRLGCIAGDYVLVVPGGGTGHPGARNAIDEFLKAAHRIAAQGTRTLFVGPTTIEPQATAHLVMTRSLPQADLAELMRSARLVVVNGGSTLLQAIASGKACIAVPIAGDQHARIRGCVSAGVAIAAPLEAVAIAHGAETLLHDEQRACALEGRAIALGLTDGVATAVRALDGMI